MPILNRSHISSALKDCRVPSIDQFKALGYEAPFLGWRDELLGMEFTIEQISRFARIKLPRNNKVKNHPKKKRTKRPKKIKPYYSDPRWDEMRKRIYKRDGYVCVSCGKRGKLNAHHLLYEDGKEVWDVPDFYLVSLCDECHKVEHSKRLISPRKVH